MEAGHLSQIRRVNNQSTTPTGTSGHYLKPRTGSNNNIDPMVEEFQQASDEEFTTFIEILLNNPESYLTNFDGEMSILGLPFTECSCCQSNAHNRLIEGNSRTTIEQDIDVRVEQLARYNKTEITILSVGSGGLLQELFMLLKLSSLGFKKIKLVMLDPIYKSPSGQILDAQTALRLIANRIQKLCESTAPVEIDLQFHSQFNDLPTTDKFDVIYAIDYDEIDSLRDNSLRELPGQRTAKTHRIQIQFVFDDGTQEEPISWECEDTSHEKADTEYQAAIDFLKSLVLLKDSDSFAALSRGKDITTYSCDNTQISKTEDAKTITELLRDTNTSANFDTIYIHSNIATLIYNLDFLSASKGSALLINKNLINEEDRSWVDALLKRYNIKPLYINESTSARILAAPQFGHRILIVDYSVYDERKNEKILPGRFAIEEKHVSIIRTNATTVENMHGIGGKKSEATFIYTKEAKTVKEVKPAEEVKPVEEVKNEESCTIF